MRHPRCEPSSCILLRAYMGSSSLTAATANPQSCRFLYVTSGGEAAMRVRTNTVCTGTDTRPDTSHRCQVHSYPLRKPPGQMVLHRWFFHLSTALHTCNIFGRRFILPLGLLFSGISVEVLHPSATIEIFFLMVLLVFRQRH